MSVLCDLYKLMSGNKQAGFEERWLDLPGVVFFRMGEFHDDLQTVV